MRERRRERKRGRRTETEMERQRGLPGHCRRRVHREWRTMVPCEILFLSLLELGSASGSDGWFQGTEQGWRLL